MFEHHKKSIENLIEYFKNDPDIISIVLGGSVAKGLERADSDIDAIIVVTDEKYAALEKENRIAECIYGYCPYENGYFDIKYTTIDYLEALAARGANRHGTHSSRLSAYTAKIKKCPGLSKEYPFFRNTKRMTKCCHFIARSA